MAMDQCVYDWEAFSIPRSFHFISFCLVILITCYWLLWTCCCSASRIKYYPEEASVSSAFYLGWIEFRCWCMGPNDRLLIEIISRSFYKGYRVVVRLSMISTLVDWQWRWQTTSWRWWLLITMKVLSLHSYSDFDTVALAPTNDAGIKFTL